MQHDALGLILDTKELGIRINVLSQGHALTPGLRSLIPEAAHAGIVDIIPLSRPGNPEDLSKAAVVLDSNDKTYITGI